MVPLVQEKNWSCQQCATKFRYGWASPVSPGAEQTLAFWQLFWRWWWSGTGRQICFARSPPGKTVLMDNWTPPRSWETQQNAKKSVANCSPWDIVVEAILIIGQGLGMFLSGSTTATASPFSLVKQSVEVVHATGQPYLGHILLVHATGPANVGIYCFVKIFSQCGQFAADDWLPSWCLSNSRTCLLREKLLVEKKLPLHAVARNPHAKESNNYRSSNTVVIHSVHLSSRGRTRTQVALSWREAGSRKLLQGESSDGNIVPTYWFYELHHTLTTIFLSSIQQLILNLTQGKAAGFLVLYSTIVYSANQNGCTIRACFKIPRQSNPSTVYFFPL